MDSTEINRAAGFAGHLTPGESPAVLVVDFHLAATDPSVSSLAVEAKTEIEKTNEIVTAARVNGVPIFYFAIGYRPNLIDAGIWPKKVLPLADTSHGDKSTEIDPRLDYRPSEDVHIVKKHASAFFGTGLAAMLTARGVDTVIITGSTTSGCIRATAVDASAHGFIPLVVADAVLDRAPAQHDANLLDIQSKYGEVVPTTAVLEYLQTSA